MTTKAIQLRRGSGAEHSEFTGLEGEITYDTDLKTIRVHDEATLGGFALARKDEVAAKAAANHSHDEYAAAGHGHPELAISGVETAKMSMPANSGKTVFTSLFKVGETITAPVSGFFFGWGLNTGGKRVGIRIMNKSGGELGWACQITNSMTSFCIPASAGQSLQIFAIDPDAAMNNDKLLFFIPCGGA